MQPAQKKFLLRFALTLVAFYGLVAIQPVNDAVVVPFTAFLVRISAALLRAIGADVARGHGHQSALFAVDVKNSCNRSGGAPPRRGDARLPRPRSAGRQLAVGLLAVSRSLREIVSLFWLGVTGGTSSTSSTPPSAKLLILLAVRIFLAWGRSSAAESAAARLRPPSGSRSASCCGGRNPGLLGVRRAGGAPLRRPATPHAEGTRRGRPRGLSVLLGPASSSGGRPRST